MLSLPVTAPLSSVQHIITQAFYLSYVKRKINYFVAHNIRRTIRMMPDGEGDWVAWSHVNHFSSVELVA